jgi:hypothetical protein
VRFVARLMQNRHMNEVRILDCAIGDTVDWHFLEANPAMCEEKECRVVAMRIKSLEAKKLKVEGHVQENLELYSKAISRHFCHQVITRLPLELRYLIYENLFTTDYIHVGLQYLTNTGSPCENDQGAHFWNAEYVGKMMYVELVESWYRLSLF